MTALTMAGGAPIVPASPRPLAPRGLVGVRSVDGDGAGLTVELDGIARSSVVAALVKAGVGVETVTARNQLEDAFLDLLGTER